MRPIIVGYIYMYMTLRGYVCVNVRSYTYNRLYKHGEV